MKIKQRIWSLPIISGVVFGLGVTISFLIATSALRSIDNIGTVDYPFLDHAKAAQATVASITEQLQSAVVEGDAEQFKNIDKRAVDVRKLTAQIEELQGHQETGRLLRAKFEAYYAPAVEAAQLMLNIGTGDLPKTVNLMQTTLSDLNPVLEQTVQAARTSVASALTGGARKIQAVLWVMVTVLLIVVALLGFLARRTTDAIWKQLGDEPEAISAAARRLAAGDLSAVIAVSANDDSSSMASMAALQSRFTAIISEVNTVADAAGHGDLSRQVALESKEGCYRDIAISVNSWSTNSQSALREVSHLLGAIARGELPPPGAHRLEGEYGELQRYGNNTVAAIEGLVSDLSDAVSRARGGDFTQKIKTDGLHGFQSKLADGINTLTEATTEGLRNVSRVLEALAQGDLTKKTSAKLEGAFGDLVLLADVSVTKLGSLVSGIRHSSEAITAAAREITSGSSPTSKQEGGGSLEQLVETMRGNADAARQAKELAHHASEAASGGKAIVTDVVSTMEAITDASKRIADIIGVIDEIAFQTNLLALNAAVEAARAGEQGRGFAVVATEVRNLAGRSATAAKEIKTLIHDSVRKVEGGSALASKTGVAMDDICASIKRVTIFVSEMDDATRHTATLMESTANVARRLEGQAQGLLEGVAAFKLSEREAPVRSSPKRSQAA